MNTPARTVTVIIPTLCSEARAEGLMRAIASARQASSQQDVEILVVANGSQVHSEVLARVRQSDTRILRQATGSAPLAVALGRSQVRSSFFAFLDDDDELLPGSLDRRLAALEAEPSVALVVSNGYKELQGKLSPMHLDMNGIADAPLRQLLLRNWLASCAGLYRASAVGQHFFEQPHGYGEWTWLAFQMCMAGLQVRSIESLDYVVHDTPQSLSKSQGYQQSYIALFDRMLSHRLPGWARRTIIRKRCAAFHDLSVRALASGQLMQSAALHWRSLHPPHGLRYLPYTRHILARAVPGR